MQTSRSDYSGTLKNCQVRGSEHLSSLRALRSSNHIFTFAGCAHPVQYKESMRSIENFWPCAPLAKRKDRSPKARGIDVDTTKFNNQTWLDREGHRHREELHLVERASRASDNHPDVLL